VITLLYALLLLAVRSHEIIDFFESSPSTIDDTQTLWVTEGRSMCNHVTALLARYRVARHPHREHCTSPLPRPALLTRRASHHCYSAPISTPMAGGFKRGGARGGGPKKSFSKKRSSPSDDEALARTAKKAKPSGSDEEAEAEPFIPTLGTDDEKNPFVSVCMLQACKVGQNMC
jgi:hypothetical protein